MSLIGMSLLLMLWITSITNFTMVHVGVAVPTVVFVGDGGDRRVTFDEGMKDEIFRAIGIGRDRWCGKSDAARVSAHCRRRRG